MTPGRFDRLLIHTVVWSVVGGALLILQFLLT